MVNIQTPPSKKTMVGKLAQNNRKKKQNVSPHVDSLVVELPALCSTPSTVSSHLSTEFLSTSSPSTMSAVSKSSSVSSTTSKIKRRLVLDDVDHRVKTKQKKTIQNWQRTILIGWTCRQPTTNASSMQTSRNSQAPKKGNSASSSVNSKRPTSRQRSPTQLAE